MFLAESDFYSMTMPENENLVASISTNLSFTSPESDFCMGAGMPAAHEPTELQKEAHAQIERTYSYASAESDFTGSAHLPENSQHPNRVMVPATLSFASPESDFCGSIAAAYGALDMGYDPLEQFRKRNKKLSFNEAIMPSSEPRVITEATAPFRIGNLLIIIVLYVTIHYH